MSERLKKLAIDIMEGRVFTSMHLHQNDDMDLLAAVFAPVAFGALRRMSESERGRVACIYEYMDKAGPRSVNGYPMFFSMQLIFEDESEQLWGYLDKYT